MKALILSIFVDLLKYLFILMWIIWNLSQEDLQCNYFELHHLHTNFIMPALSSSPDESEESNEGYNQAPPPEQQKHLVIKNE